MARKLIFENTELPLMDEMSIEEAKEWASVVIPGLENAEGLEDEDGNYVFTKKAGKKFPAFFYNLFRLFSHCPFNLQNNW